LMQLSHTLLSRDKPFRTFQHHVDKQRTVEKQAVIFKFTQQLGQANQDQSADNDARRVAHTTNDNQYKHGDGHQNLEAAGEDGADLSGEEGAAKAGNDSTDDKSGKLGHHD